MFWGRTIATGALLALPLTACTPSGSSISALAEKRVALEEQLDQIKKQISSERTALNQAVAEHSQLSKSRSGAIKDLREVAAAIQTAAQDFQDYRNRYRAVIQSKAHGMHLGDFSVGIRNYQSVVVSSVNNIQLSFMHSGGAAKVELAQLPDELQELFAFDPSLVEETRDAQDGDPLAEAIKLAQSRVNQLSESPLTDGNGVTGPGAPPASLPPANGIVQGASTSTADEPYWKKTNSFTGSYWAPMSTRKKKVGGVNSTRRYGYSDGSIFNYSP